MIARTLLEWSTLPYDPDPANTDTIPDWAADRLARVARTSSLAGRGEEGVLEHGRTRLRARGVVGVVAAEGVALEILPKIDFAGADGEGRVRERLVHMLAVALDLDVASGRMAALGSQRENLLEVLIGLFVRALTDAVRHGMPRRYLAEEEDLPTLRGRLDVGRQFTTLAASPQRLACRYDALSPDIALNRIMKAAVARLAWVSRAPANQRGLRELGHVYADIAAMPVQSLAWDQVVLDRTNRRWRGLLDFARLLLGERFQTTSAGDARGYSLLFDMNMLFERYVARLLARALAGSDHRVVTQGGRLFCLTSDVGGGLFQTRPDILIKRGAETVQVIDTKWKRIAARIDDPKRGVSQADVYQMMAYGRLYGCRRLTLLYPHHREVGSEAGLLSDHAVTGSADRLEVATIDVAQPRGEVAGRLAALCGLPQPVPGTGSADVG